MTKTTPTPQEPVLACSVPLQMDELIILHTMVVELQKSVAPKGRNESQQVRDQYDSLEWLKTKLARGIDNLKVLHLDEHGRVHQLEKN